MKKTPGWPFDPCNAIQLWSREAAFEDGLADLGRVDAAIDLDEVTPELVEKHGTEALLRFNRVAISYRRERERYTQ